MLLIQLLFTLLERPTRHCFVVATEPMVIYLSSTGRLLEAAGAALLQRQPLSVLGRNLVAAGNELAILSGLYKTLASSKGQQQTTNLVVQDAAQRCLYASQQMIDAGTRLLPMDERPKTMTSSMGKQW